MLSWKRQNVMGWFDSLVVIGVSDGVAFSILAELKKNENDGDGY